MKHSGKIVIKDNRVYFEPDGLEKPDKENYYGYICNPQRPRVKYRRGRLYEKEYQKDMKEYEASKQLIEVSNVLPHLLPRLNEQKVDIYYDVIFQDKSFEQVKNNQRCEAEVNKNEAVIVKIN